MDTTQKLRSLKWDRWLERPFKALLLSFSQDAGKKEYFKKIGLEHFEIETVLFQNGAWYENKESMERLAERSIPYIKHNTIFNLTKRLSKFRSAKKKRILKLIDEKTDIKEKLAELHDIFTICLTFVWSTHVLEYYYKKKIEEEVPKYFKGDVNLFVGDASFPKKKNSYALMEDEMRKGVKPEIVAKKYGWLRARDGYSDPFTAEDIKKHMKDLKPAEKHKNISVPQHLKSLFEEMQELVFFRTERTDVLYELLFLARPIFKRACDHYGIPFKDIRYYTIQSLAKGKPVRYGENVSFSFYKEESVYSNEPIISEKETKNKDYAKGNIAFRGIIKGYAKIVKVVSELDKVQKGDVLVTQMTFPSFIAAMNRAAAFVTDEGGITCHAAIVAREMKKPCITGTKIATKIFKDGDYIEVDANKGIVRKI